MRAKISGEFVSGGIDYLTVTTKPGPAMHQARQFAFAIASDEISAGMFGRPWSSSGYDGLSVGHLTYGERYDGSIIRLGSELAHRQWTNCKSFADNVTRIDLQATFRVTDRPLNVIQRHYKELQRFTRQRTKGPAVSMLLGHDGSRTVYSGRRASNIYGRVYDKALESKMDQWSNCVRYEVELKGNRARSVFHQLTPGEAAIAEASLASLEFFAGRGAVVSPLLKSIPSSTTVVDLKCFDRVTDISRSLAWLRNQVRPSVIALADRGLLQSVIESLSMGHLVHHYRETHDETAIH